LIFFGGEIGFCLSCRSFGFGAILMEGFIKGLVIFFMVRQGWGLLFVERGFVELWMD
jgi:hypothetical protein